MHLQMMVLTQTECDLFDYQTKQYILKDLDDLNFDVNNN